MAIDLICRLLKALEQANISYCHWKSNAAIDASLAGDTDMDLLVAKEDKEEFVCVLSQMVH